MQNNFKKIIAISIFLNVAMPSLGFAKEAPETVGDAKAIGLSIINQLPDAIKKVWREEALPLFERMWIWSKPAIDPWWQKLSGILGREVEKRKPAVEEEFKKEKEEMWNDLWQRFKDLII